MVGWAPTNGSFEAFVTALRLTEGDEAAREWLEAMEANGAQSFDSNSSIRDAIAAGEIDVGLINHYYVAQAQAEEGEGYPVVVYFPPNGDIGALINVAGAGVLAAASDQQDEATEVVEFLLSPQAQRYFAAETKEYPLLDGVEADPAIVPLSEIDQPQVDLSNLDDLQGTLTLIENRGSCRGGRRTGLGAHTRQGRPPPRRAAAPATGARRRPAGGGRGPAGRLPADRHDRRRLGGGGDDLALLHR